MVSHDIGWAVDQMRSGKRVCRSGWNGKGMWVELVNSDRAMFKDRPLREYAMMFTAQHDCVPWVCSQSDLLAEDWEVVD